MQYEICLSRASQNKVRHTEATVCPESNKESAELCGPVRAGLLTGRD